VLKLDEKITFGTNLKCLKCGTTYPLQIIYDCPVCGGILDAEYDYEKVSGQKLLMNFEKARSIWRFKALLPVRKHLSIVSLSEGNTPLFKCHKLGAKLGLCNLYIKDETRNPTGSFKDRPISVALSKANEEGKKIVITSSTGSAGNSIAAYAAKAEMKSIVLVPSCVSSVRSLQIVACGGTLVKIKGTYSDCFRIVKALSQKFDWVNLTSTFLNPFAVEGDKTVAYELNEQLGNVPDWILVPIGAGPLLVGIYKGCKELEKLGLVSGLPAMAGIQAEGCAPIVRAFKSKDSRVKHWDNPETVALGIADPLRGYTQDGTLTLQTIRESGGVAIEVDDETILESISMLARSTGVFAEPAGVTSVTGVKKLVEEGIIKKNDLVVCIITGSGFKDLGSVRKKIEITEEEVEPSIEKVEKILNKKGF